MVGRRRRPPAPLDVDAVPGTELRVTAVGAAYVVRVRTDASIATIELRQGDHVLDRRAADGPRPRLATHRLALGPTADIAVVGVGVDGGDDDVALGHLRGPVDAGPLGGVRSSGPQPISVLGAARGGSTAAMRLLAAHPDVAVVDEPPHEDRIAAHRTHQLLATAGTAGPARSFGHRSLSDPAMRDLAGPSPAFRPERPAFDWFAAIQLPREAQRALDDVEDLHEALGAGDTTAFAEKFVPEHVQRAWDLLYAEHRRLVVLRDPRDVALSQQAMNARRGFAGFSADGLSLPALVRRAAVVQVRALGAARAAIGPTAVVRYEALVREPEATIADALRELALDDGDASVERCAAAVAERGDHGTSASATASVRRHEAELDDDERLAVAPIVDAFERLVAGEGTDDDHALLT